MNFTSLKGPEVCRKWRYSCLPWGQESELPVAMPGIMGPDHLEEQECRFIKPVPGLLSQPQLSVLAWVGYLTSLGLRLFVDKTGIIKVAAP